MSHYTVLYRTPSADGAACVDADGIESARLEAKHAVSVLSGHPLEQVIPRAIMQDEVTLWWNPSLYTPSAKELERKYARTH